VRLGRPAEAVSAYRQAIEHKNRVLAVGTTTKSRLHSLGNHYIGLAEAKLALGQHARAAATLLEQRQIWENDADGLYSLACGLAQCVLPAAKDLAGSPQKRQAECQRYVDLSLEALRQAVAAGYRDAAHIWRDADLAPLRSRKEIHALVGISRSRPTHSRDRGKNGSSLPGSRMPHSGPRAVSLRQLPEAHRPVVAA
jgi:hypothetical protein